MFSIDPSVDYNTIIWNEIGICERVKNRFGFGPAFKPWKAIYEKMKECANVCIRQSWNIHNGLAIKYPKKSHYCPLDMTVPPLAPPQYDPIINEIRNIMTNFIKEKIRSLSAKNLNDETLSDCEYLCLLGTIRNYKSGCAICLSNDIIGTTCACGCSEIAVFRPCGHCMCANPCFYQYVESNGINLKRNHNLFVENHYQQESYCFGTHRDINVGGFLCPNCRCNVKSTIRVEDTFVNSEWSDEIKHIAMMFVEKHINEYDRYLYFIK
jgi:hypothetical protein